MFFSLGLCGWVMCHTTQKTKRKKKRQNERKGAGEIQQELRWIRSEIKQHTCVCMCLNSCESHLVGVSIGCGLETTSLSFSLGVSVCYAHLICEKRDVEEGLLCLVPPPRAHGCGVVCPRGEGAVGLDPGALASSVAFLRGRGFSSNGRPGERECVADA